MYNCLLFDLDGTLLDTREVSCLALRDALEICTGVIHPLAELDKLFGVSILRLFDNQVFKLDDFEKFRQTYEDCYRQHSTNASLYPGVEDALKKLSSMGIPLGVITAKERWEYEHDFGRFGYSQYFLKSVCIEDVKNGKPDPEPLLKFFDLTGISKEKALYIGDTAIDERAAHAAGIDFGYPAWNGCAPVANTDIAFKTAKELLNYVSR